MLLNHNSFNIVSNLSTFTTQPHYILFLKCFFLCTRVLYAPLAFCPSFWSLVSSLGALSLPLDNFASHARPSFLCVFYLDGAFYSMTFGSIYVLMASKSVFPTQVSFLFICQICSVLFWPSSYPSWGCTKVSMYNWIHHTSHRTGDHI